MGATRTLRSPWVNVDGHEGVGGAFPGAELLPRGSYEKWPPGKLISVTGLPPVGPSCLTMGIHAGVVPGNEWT